MTSPPPAQELRLPDAELPVRIGGVLRGKWTIERLIGLGGMSVVYRARHRNGRPVALKVLRPELALRAGARARFLREGYIANRVHHPGVVSILDDDSDGAVIFLVMELLVGETLGARWKRAGRRLPLLEALLAVDAVLDVLIAAHAEGVAHRDLKPENVFLCQDGRVKVLDFGIASSVEMRAARPILQPGVSFGTPGYMAREQARGLWEDVDGQTDLWALGATLFTLLTGRHVFEGKSPKDMVIAAATQEPDSIGLQLPDLPAGVVELVDRALRVDKAERWRDALSMQEALRALLAPDRRALRATPIQHAATTTARSARSEEFPCSLRSLMLLSCILLAVAHVLAFSLLSGTAERSAQVSPLPQSAAPARSPAVVIESERSPFAAALEAPARGAPIVVPVPEPTLVPRAGAVIEPAD